MEYQAYYNRLKKACERLETFYSGLDESARDQLYQFYSDKRLDPDGRAIRTVFDVDCTADGLLTFYQICRHEEKESDIIRTYKEYSKEPIIFFPCEIGGINTSRAAAFGDRIDHTLFDLKNYFIDARDDCRLLKAYNRPFTQKWLQGMGSFDSIIDWWGIKGIFADESYNVYDIETGSVVDRYKSPAEYQEQWSKRFYDGLKQKIEQFHQKRNRFRFWKEI